MPKIRTVHRIDKIDRADMPSIYKIMRKSGTHNSVRHRQLYYEDRTKLMNDLMRFDLEKTLHKSRSGYESQNKTIRHRVSLWLKMKTETHKGEIQEELTKDISVYGLINDEWVELEYQVINPDIELYDSYQ